jgi:hypothetical protein
MFFLSGAKAAYNLSIKKILKLFQELLCTTSMAFIEDSAPQKNAGKQLSTRFFAAPASTNAGKNKIKENKILNEYSVKKIIIMP